MRVGFIGAGKMAKAMIRGLISHGIAPGEILVCTSNPVSCAAVSSEYGVRGCKSPAEVAKEANILVLAVKPVHVRDVLSHPDIRMNSRHLLISVAAGIRISTLRTYVPDARIVRVMPNLCSAVISGVSCYTMGDGTDSDDEKTVRMMLESMGRAFRIEEKDMDAVSGLSGSSPAFVFMVIDALADGGVRMGLSEEFALELAALTVEGAARTVMGTGEDPDILKENVCSPGGTTIEGVKVLEEGGLRKLISDAVVASARKSERMSKG
ncbi:MAG: pyrroline-5-carboxylate reductase [Candidatus Methanomethylophilaceae archaeon]|nr:pyrroline-5-carboxylate reductase [Candidatus Methanomethylophilaceae archaeon]